MPPLNPLIDSVLLFEGSDYTSWRKRTTAIVAHKLYLPSSYELGPVPFVKRLAAMDFIKCNVSDYLLDRIPKDDMGKPSCFLERLKLLARPLRFLDLPEHVRSRVYKHTFDGVFDINDYAPSHEDGPYPCLLQVSRQVRAEATPIFYNETEFRFRFDRSQPSFQTAREECVAKDLMALHHWVCHIAGTANLKLLRTLRIESKPWVTFHLESNSGATGPEGLNSAFEEYFVSPLTQESRERLKEYVNATETFRKAAGLQGESLVLLLTLKPDLWAGPHALE